MSLPRRSLPRRNLLGAGLAVATAALAGCTDRTAPKWADGADGAGGSGRATGGAPAGSGGPAGAGGPAGPGAAADLGPGTAQIPDPSSTAVLSPQNTAAYTAKLTATLQRFLKPTTENPNHPTYAGAVALVMVDGRIITQLAVGHALRYGAGPVELPADKRVAMRAGSIFDLASLTKVYVAILTLQQVEQGRLDLAAPVVDYLPGFTGAGKEKVTVRMLLTHTSGLPVGATVAGLPDLAAKRKAVLATPLIKDAVPGAVFRYSSVGLMVAAQLVEEVTGKGLDAALKAGITGPLGLSSTGFKPPTWLNAEDRASLLVATDARSSRGLLRGVVHDDVANHLGGIAGHAGIFAPAREVAVIGQLLLDGGVYQGRRILSAESVQTMLSNANRGLPAIDPERPGRPSDHGLGVTLGQPWFMGRLSSPASFGHTGFTGTSLVVDPRRRTVFVLLTNRAHPNWSWANPDPVRVQTANVLADAIR